ncbi:hypothetical protein H1P_1220001 [Hyella patelloides LEGE 07179]|uniref:Uncharacterized protein n=1 Tax=Hyella patelloides LEGE 07179 TaxID=945734 RepID=A0A563VKA0_9CYAN|nr:hypothetical protein H1P_1220001 [Hyella patelloides LEGE 07179]
MTLFTIVRCTDFSDNLRINLLSTGLINNVLWQGINKSYVINCLKKANG